MDKFAVALLDLGFQWLAWMMCVLSRMSSLDWTFFHCAQFGEREVVSSPRAAAQYSVLKIRKSFVKR